jgi:type IV pilus assembly protein PilY1
MKTNTKKLLSMTALCAALAAPVARASDIDLFAGIQTVGIPPSVLFVLDNSGAWNANVSFACPSSVMTLPAGNQNTAGGFEQCSLSAALQAVAADTNLASKLNMGLMLFSTGSTNGGTFYYPSNKNPGQLPLMDATGIKNFRSAVAALTVGGSGSNTANASAVGATMQEAWAFFAAKTGFSGTKYDSPLANACQKNFVIYIANANNMGKPQDNTDNTVFQTLACPAGSTGPAGASCAGATSAQQAQITVPVYPKYQGNWGDEWARYNYQTDLSGNFANQQNIVTYTIAVTDGSNPDYVALLRSMASNGGGKLFVVTLGDMGGLIQAILQILNEVQAVDSVFASASLPVSANAQGTYQNQIFMGMFRPDPSANPRWMGNLKQYQFGVDLSSGSVELFMADATGAHALSSSGTGFISPNAISFWTSTDPTKLPDSKGGFWVNKVQGVSGGLDDPDGEVVEKGGVGQQIRLANLMDDYIANPASPRNMYTYCPSGTGCIAQLSDVSNAFATTNAGITSTMLGTTASPISITSISRTGTTATVTLSSAPAPALAAGQTVTITNSVNGYNGAYTIASAPSTNQFTINVTPIPPSPAQGTFQVATPGSTLTVTSLTRAPSTDTKITNPNFPNTTAIVTTSTPNGLVVGQSVTISGGPTAQYSSDPHYSAYYGTFQVTYTSANDSNLTANQFGYTVAEGPATTLDAANATATIGSASYQLTTSANQTVTAPSIQRQPSTYASGKWSSVITVNTATALAKSVSAGNIVTIAGTGTPYDGQWTISGVGKTACPGVTVQLQSNAYAFCFNMPTTPLMPNPSTATTATPISNPISITSLSWTTDNCPTSSTATATAATSALILGYVPGTTVVNVGGTPGVNENAYVGNVLVTNMVTKGTFQYSIATRPLCADGPSTSPGITATFGGTVGAPPVSRDTLIDWVRGQDNFGDEPSPGNGITIRPSVHGDVVHARPTVVNYGGSIGVVVYYGAGDGAFRAVNGNQPGSTPTSNSIGSTPPGGEIWSFLPQEFYPKLLRLHNNNPVIQYFSTPSGITPTPLAKDYFFDGIAGVYQNFTTGKVVLFLSARRGGRLIYALDVTDPTRPLFLWRHSNTDTGFAELGQTWSTPKVAILKGWSNPVLIFGAGYDPNEDAEPPTSDTMGRGIFVLDAFTGAIVWQANGGGSANSCTGTPCTLKGMTYAIPADVTLLDIDFDGNVDRAYAADLGGNVWRIDFEPSGGNTPAFWQVNQLAALGGASTDATKRKFFFPPDAVVTNKYTGVMAVTGDREHPLYAMQSTSIVNRFYMLKDTLVGKDATGMTPILDSTGDTTDTQPSSLFNATSTPYDGTLSGFYVSLVNAGEKGVNAPITVGGFTFFGTNTPTAPSPNACNASLGTARSYQIGFLTGSVAYNLLQGGGLPPSPVAGLVNVNTANGTVTVPFIIGGSSPGCIGADCQSSIGAQKANIPIKQTRARAYWYRDVDK